MRELREECHLTKPYHIIEVNQKEYGPLDAIRFEVCTTKSAHGNDMRKDNDAAS